MKYSHSLQKLLWSIIAITLSLYFFSACGNPSALEIGFDRGGRLPSLMSAVKSDHTDFEINDVTLDFYFGGLADEYPPDHEHISVGVALYFCNEEAYSALELDTPYSDYQTLDGLYFIKIINTEEFNSGNYEVDISGFGKATFLHCETITVPSEVFIEGNDHFGLAMLDIYCLKGQTDYYVSCAGGLEIKYEFLDAQSVRLSKPAHVFL